MRMWIVALGLVALVGGFAAEALEFQKHAAESEPRLSARIPAADRARYKAVRVPRDWGNPYLLASATGFELKSASSPKPRAVSLKDLRRKLTDLPISDWPYGRVVVVQSPSIVPGDPAWVEAMKRNVDDGWRFSRRLEQTPGGGPLSHAQALWRPNRRMEPARQSSGAIMSRRRAAHS